MEKIIFLYKQANVPDEIIAEAKKRTPAGFELIFCEEKMSAEERRKMSPQQITSCFIRLALMMWI